MTTELKRVEERAISPANRMKNLINNNQVKEMFKNSLGENTGAFLSSLVELYSDPTGLLKECNPNEVVMEALKSATLKLPINKNLGFAYILPFKKNEKTPQGWISTTHPQFQIGYKGFIQLAMRTGQYKTINSNMVYEGMEVVENYLTGEIEIKGRKKSDKIIGYFSYFKLVNGFEKMIYWTTEQIENHAKKFSKSYSGRGNKGNVWTDNFDEMALKTVTKRILSKYGVLSVELQNLIVEETDREFQEELNQNANKLELNVTDAVVVDEVIEDVTVEEVPEEVKEDTKAPF